MDAERIVAMLSEDRKEWAALTAVLEEHAERSLHGRGSPMWTAADVYTHLARWMSRSTDDLEARLERRTLTPLEGTDDEINARWQAEDSHLTLAEAREWAHRAFERRIRAIEAVPHDRWDPVLQMMARADGSEHYAGHRRYITGE